MQVNGDMMSKNSEMACFGSTLKQKRCDGAEKEPGMQRNERELSEEGGSAWPELGTCPFNKKNVQWSGENKRKKESGKSQVIQKWPT